MKRFPKALVCAALGLALCVTPALGANTHNHRERPFPERVQVSPWAQREVEESRALGFGPNGQDLQYLPDSLATPIYRVDLCEYLARFIAMQQGCGEADFSLAVIHYLGREDSYGQPVSAFSDADGLGYLTALYHLGAVKGRGDGTFDLGGELTRQEAATFLARTYAAYGGELPQATETIAFTDQAEIADWALDSVSALAEAGIMKGYEDGRFAPNDPYSYEQCLMTLVRLYEELPVSRKNGSVEALFTYEQYLDYFDYRDRKAVENNAGLYKIQQVDGPVASFVHMATGGSMNTAAFPKLVYRSGAVRSLEDLGVCNTGMGWLRGSTEIDNLRFSEDGRTLYCTITLAQEGKDLSGGDPETVAHGHAAGTYSIVIDVESGKATAQREQ